jgi:hypothetical protein
LCGQIWSDVKNLESSYPKIIQLELFILNLSNSPLIPFHGEIQIMVQPLPPPLPLLLLNNNNKGGCNRDPDHGDDDYHHDK